VVGSPPTMMLVRLLFAAFGLLVALALWNTHETHDD
jgi:hypothetical protein